MKTREIKTELLRELAEYYRVDPEACWTFGADDAAKFNVPESTLERILNSLKDEGLISRARDTERQLWDWKITVLGIQEVEDEDEDEDVSSRKETVQSNRRKVFIIHGRNSAARVAIEHFLKALKLEPLDFEELAGDMGTEFIGNIVLEGLRRAQGIVSLFTPDEFAALLPALRGARDPASDIRRWQSRPNVIFEAGIAFGLARERSAIVTMGEDVSLFSDVAGIHILRLTNSVDSRKKFRQKLIGMGCELDQRSDAWIDPATSGDFESCLECSLGVSPRDPFP